MFRIGICMAVFRCIKHIPSPSYHLPSILGDPTSIQWGGIIRVLKDAIQPTWRFELFSSKLNDCIHPLICQPPSFLTQRPGCHNQHNSLWMDV